MFVTTFFCGKILQTTKYCVILGTFKKNRTYYRLENKSSNHIDLAGKEEGNGKETGVWSREYYGFRGT